MIRFVRGEVDSHDGRFLPTSAELGREISSHYVAMKAPIPRVAWTPERPRQEPDEASKDRVREAVRNLKQRIAQSQMERAE